MRIGVLGTGIVGRSIAARCAEVGHEVVIGTRDPAATLARAESDSMGNPPFAAWHAEHGDIELLRLDAAAARSSVLVNATAGGSSLAGLAAAGADNIAGKLLIDVSNPLDFSHGDFRLSVANTDSTAEQIQAAHPTARVVKTLNTVTAAVMVAPARLAGESQIFVAGDDAGSKAEVRGLLTEFGWSEHGIIDLGGIRSARGMEMYVALWVGMAGALGTPMFNIRIVREKGAT